MVQLETCRCRGTARIQLDTASRGEDYTLNVHQDGKQLGSTMARIVKINDDMISENIPLVIMRQKMSKMTKKTLHCTFESNRGSGGHSHGLRASCGVLEVKLIASELRVVDISDLTGLC